MKPRILINDHSGHAFPIDLSSRLAQKGFPILHTYSSNFQGPKGNFDKFFAPFLKIVPIAYDKPFNKYSIIKRRKQEIEYAEKLIKEVIFFKPAILICCNTPLFVQERIQKFCIKNNINFVFWCQDIYSLAIEKILIKKLGALGGIAGRFFRKMELRQLLKSDHIVTITEDFNLLFSTWGVSLSKISVIPNWAPIKEIPVEPKDNSWAKKYSLENKFCITYSGTLGLKHNPSLLFDIAKYYENNPKIIIVVVSEGLGADYLNVRKEKEGLTNLIVLPFQNFKDLPKVLGSSNILLAILEPDAGLYSVPSKVLSYLCAGRPIILSVPFDNLASKLITVNHSGIVTPPEASYKKIVEAIDYLFDHPIVAAEMGQNARQYAERHFDIECISQKFLQIVESLHYY